MNFAELPDHEEVVMGTATLRVRWWPAQRLFSRNPLVRAVDRLEALAVLLAVTVPLLVLPFAAAAGTAVYDSRSHAYTQQARPRPAIA